MRVILVGAEPARRRMRAELNGSIEVAGEFATLGAARAAAISGAALLVAPNRRPPSDDDHLDEPLTVRERQVLELLAEGLPNKAIARRLGISDQTVKFHVASLTGKLGAANRTDAVRRAIGRGLVAL